MQGAGIGGVYLSFNPMILLQGQEGEGQAFLLLHSWGQLSHDTHEGWGQLCIALKYQHGPTQ